jgi:hypothetical protein
MRVKHKRKWSSKVRHRGEVVEIDIERAKDSLLRVMNTIIGWRGFAAYEGAKLMTSQIVYESFNERLRSLTSTPWDLKRRTGPSPRPSLKRYVKIG